jgi:hypothetical protein
VILIWIAILIVFVAVVAVTSLTRPEVEHLPADMAVLDQQCRGLRSLIAAAGSAPLVSPRPVLFVVHEDLVQRILSSTTPYERIVADKYKVRVDSIAVRFVDGFALVRLDGRASLLNTPAKDISAEISVYGGLEIVGVDTTTGALRGRVSILAVEAHKVAVLGMEPPVERLVEDISQSQIAKFGVLLSKVEIPIQLQRVLYLPEVGPEGGVHIAAARVPLEVVVEDAKAFHHKLWITAAARVADESEAERRAAAGDTSSARDGAAQAGRGAPRGVTGHIVQSGRHLVQGRRFRLFVNVPQIAARYKSTQANAHQQQLAALRRTEATLRDSLERIIRSDALISSATQDNGDVLLIIRGTFVTHLLRTVLREYLDRVELDLYPEKKVHKTKDLPVDTPIGVIAVGAWDVRVTVNHIKGVLQTRNPSLAITGTNRIHVALPISIVQGRGAITLYFKWDSKGIANVVCRDFETTQHLSGTVVPDDYGLAGDFVLTSQGERLIADPEFPREKYSIHVNLDAGSWDQVWRILQDQNRVEKCGLFMHPQDVMERLRKVSLKGVKVKLPKKMFRPVDFPISISRSVEVGDRRVELTAVPKTLRVTPEAFWYSAALTTRFGAAPTVEPTKRHHHRHLRLEKPQATPSAER